MSTPKIPAGWRRVTTGRVREGDQLIDIGGGRYAAVKTIGKTVKWVTNCRNGWFAAVIHRTAERGRKVQPQKNQSP